MRKRPYQTRKKPGGPPVERLRSDRDERAAAEERYASSRWRWWKESDSRMASAMLWSWVDRNRANAMQDGNWDLLYEAAYRGRPVGSGSGYGGQYLLLKSGALINLNVIMSMVDTATARLTKRRPMAQISADDAPYSEKRFATETSRVLRRKMGSTYVDAMSPLVIRDMCIRGDGVMKAERKDGDVVPKRIPIYELIVDPFEAEHGGPRTMVHLRPEPREVMCARFPKFASVIEDAPTYDRRDPWALAAYPTPRTHDYIDVCEAWHLPSSPDADDGQHVISVHGSGEPVVLREYWDVERFPIVRFHWSPPTRGWRGEGLVAQLWGIQEQVNDILRDAREGLKNGSQLTVFVQRGANVDKHHLRKRHPKIIEFDGQKPEYVAPNPVSEQAIRILLMLIEQAREMSGLNDTSVSGQNPLGASASGKALETMEDLQSNRFAHVEAGWQQGRVQLGGCLVDGARALYDAVHGDDDERDAFEEAPEEIEEDDLAPWIANTKWSQVEVDGGAYHIVLEPVNYLADAREGRLAQVAELGKNGIIPDPAMQADLFTEPDIQRANRAILGPKHFVDAICEALTKPSIPLSEIQPDQHMNLEYAVLQVNGEMNEAAAQMGFPRAAEDETILDRYRQWIDLARAELKRRAPGVGAVSPMGAMPADMMAAQNAATLQPGLAGPSPAPMAPGMGAGPGVPQGMMS